MGPGSWTVQYSAPRSRTPGLRNKVTRRFDRCGLLVIEPLLKKANNSQCCVTEIITSSAPLRLGSSRPSILVRHDLLLRVGNSRCGV